MRLNDDLRARLDSELGQLRHLTRAERELWATVRANGTARRSVVRELAAELAHLPHANPTPAEAELIRVVGA